MTSGRDVHAEFELTVHERDLDALVEPMARWLSATIGRTVTISNLHAPQGAGMSSVTLLFDADDRHFVARMPPEATSFPVFPNYDIAQQFELMRLVATHSDVPVPPLMSP